MCTNKKVTIANELRLTLGVHEKRTIDWHFTDFMWCVFMSVRLSFETDHWRISLMNTQSFESNPCSHVHRYSNTQLYILNASSATSTSSGSVKMWVRFKEYQTDDSITSDCATNAAIFAPKGNTGSSSRHAEYSLSLSNTDKNVLSTYSSNCTRQSRLHPPCLL